MTVLEPLLINFNREEYGTCRLHVTFLNVPQKMAALVILYIIR